MGIGKGARRMRIQARNFLATLPLLWLFYASYMDGDKILPSACLISANILYGLLCVADAIRWSSKRQQVEDFVDQFNKL